jgi:hypothetical protein
MWELDDTIEKLWLRFSFPVKHELNQQRVMTHQDFINAAYELAHRLKLELTKLPKEPLL